jgi:ADP-heptose:LPS heptosyltransferase
VSRPVLLAYRALGLGDFLTGIPALRALRDAHPDHHLVLAAPAALGPLVALAAVVDEHAVTEPLAPPPGAGVAIAVNLHGRGPESHRALLGAGPGRLIAFANAEAGVDGPEWREDEHEVRRWCRLLEESGIPADPGRLELPRPPAPGGAPACVIHPGAASPARQWPASRWAQVAAALRDQGRRVVVTGSAGERHLAGAVVERAGLPPEADLAGRTDLLGLAAHVAAAALVLSADTGVAHLATAFGTPSVTLFGPTPPEEWGPPPERPQHVALHRGGRGDPHGERPDAGLLEITVADVLGVTASRFPPSPAGSPRTWASPTRSQAGPSRPSAT